MANLWTLKALTHALLMPVLQNLLRESALPCQTKNTCFKFHETLFTGYLIIRFDNFKIIQGQFVMVLRI